MAWEARASAVFLLVLLLTATAGVGSSGYADPADAAAERLIVTDLSTLPTDLGEALAQVGGEHLRTDSTLDFAVVEAPAAALSALLPGHVHLDPVVEGPQVRRAPADGGGLPNDEFNGQQWALEFLDMESAWALETGSLDVKVAVVDSGLDADHEDLAGLPVELGTDYVEGGTVDGDPHGHGTHITGIIAGIRGNSIGITGMSEVSLMNIRVLGADNKGFCSDFYSGIAEAAVGGADVINYSIGSFCLAFNLVDVHTTLTTEDALLVGITHNLWNGGTLNGLVNCMLVNQLDAYPNVMAVTAIDDDGDVTHFSCRAPWAEIAAPGKDVLSTVPYDGPPTGWMGQRYQFWWGTSMAAPHVTATAALMKSANPELTAQELRALIVQTADDAGLPGWDYGYGFGIVDPDGAIQAALDHPISTP